MFEAIFIIKEDEDKIDEESSYHSIAMRLKDQNTLDFIINNSSTIGLDESIILYENINSPNGESYMFGSPNIYGFKNILKVIKSAMKNKESILNINNFNSNTPIYLFKENNKAEKIKIGVLSNNRKSP